MRTYSLIIFCLGLLMVSQPNRADRSDIKRTLDGKPDFSGVYDAATLTPLERPTQFGERSEPRIR